MNKRVILAPRYNLRVEDFDERHVLATECMNCGGKGVVSTKTLQTKYKPYERIKLIEGDLRCHHCGKSGVCHWHVEEIAPL